MVRIVLVLLGLACWPALPRAQTAQDAERFVRRVYAKYYPQRDGPGQAWMAADVVTPSLAALVRANDHLNGRFNEPGPINADPFCECQDADGLKVERLKVSMVDGGAVADVGLTFFGKSPTTVRLLLKPEGGTWRVNDIGAGNEGVRATLAASNACRQRLGVRDAPCW